jgi:hypothetical protein
MLGVRVGPPKHDVIVDDRGRVVPGYGGMSVSPCSKWHLPNHRRPKAMGRGSTGPRADRVYELALTPVRVVGLAVRADPEHPFHHALVAPETPLEIHHYEDALAATRDEWTQVWP